MSARSGPVTVRVRRLAHAVDGGPVRMTEGSAGFDLPAANTDPVELDPGGSAVIPTGLVLEIPEGFEGQVRPRSGLALRHGITLTNSPGTIDADYRGEIAVLLINHGPDPFVVYRGQRIAQLVIQHLPQVRFEEVSRLSATSRGEGGFGSTGTGENEHAE